MISLLAVIGIMMSACSGSDDSSVPSELEGLLDHNWGTDIATVKQSASIYNVETDGNYLYVSSYKPSCIISYEFDANGLCTMALVGSKEQITESYINGLKSGYTELGEINSGKTVYVNESKNKIMEVQSTMHNGLECYAIGWSKYQ